MKYGDVIHFEPIQSVKVLRDADTADQAAEDVRTFVISERMADQLSGVIFPNLDFSEPRDTRGLLVVANYGTGKTHLMSVIAAIAENADLSGILTNESVKRAAESIAGRFKVIRAEIGATRMGLRDIVCHELEVGLKKLGVSFDFPDMATITNNKDSLADMMATFEAVYPDQGLLFVLDELLDYLRKRRDAELVEDLQFLREVGEVCGSLRFRFVAGIQEALFDNPRFANVASDMGRVRDRFTQVRISREDVAYVVKERLLRKTAPQRDIIRGHLQSFTPLYEGMAENLEEFVALFPVHPAFIRTFERITPIEQREMLKTLSSEMTALLDRDVPEDEPGLVCYDRYRGRMADDPGVRAIPEVREVLDKSDVLRNRIEQAMPSKHFVPVARRIIDALTVHRLTTEDIYTPIGATPRELCDDLCLMPGELPEKDAAFLELTVGTVIDEILKAVSGQFITINHDNGQVYLDIKKDIDYDQRIQDRAGSLDADSLDTAYFHALEEVLERRDLPYVAGYRIWEYDLPWKEKNVTRFGYLFMGAPNERSTAQPPRDFYVYFLHPYDPPKFTDELKEDEVFFRLDNPDEVFTGALRRYAGASALADESTQTHRAIYLDKKDQALREMVTWLRTNMGTAFDVSYRGEVKPLNAWLAGGAGPRGTIKDQVDTIAATALEPHFDARYPGYPKFSARVTRNNLAESVQQALTQVASGRSTQNSRAILQSLGLLGSQGDLVVGGEFADSLVQTMVEAGGKVVNRSDLLSERDRGIPTWGSWHLEPAWLVVIGAVLTQLGKLEIGYAGSQIDALNLDRLAKMSFNELEGFSHLSPPKALPVVQIREVTALYKLAPGIIKDSGPDDAAVLMLLKATTDLLSRVDRAKERVRDGMALWGAPVIEQAEEREQRLTALQKFLEDMKARNTIGRLNNLNVDSLTIEAAKRGISELEATEAASLAHERLNDVANYLRESAEVFGPDYTLTSQAGELRSKMLELFRTGQAEDVTTVALLKSEAEQLRDKFAEAAERAIAHDTLDGEGDERKRRILEGDAYRDLKELAAVSLLPGGEFGRLQRQLVDLPVCKFYDTKDLRQSVLLPDSTYRPKASSGPSAAARLQEIESQLEKLRADWERALVDNLGVPEMQEGVPLLDPNSKASIEGFLESKALPDLVSTDFVKALNDLLGGFEVRWVKPEELWNDLFPDRSPATVPVLRERFASILESLRHGVPEDKIRVVPADDEGHQI